MCQRIYQPSTGRDALRFVAGVHAFNEEIQELEDGVEKSLFMQLADKWFALVAENLDTGDIEDKLGDNWQ